MSQSCQLMMVKPHPYTIPTGTARFYLLHIKTTWLSLKHTRKHITSDTASY